MFISWWLITFLDMRSGTVAKAKIYQIFLQILFFPHISTPFNIYHQCISWSTSTKWCTLCLNVSLLDETHLFKLKFAQIHSQQQAQLSGHSWYPQLNQTKHPHLVHKCLNLKYMSTQIDWLDDVKLNLFHLLILSQSSPSDPLVISDKN